MGGYQLDVTHTSSNPDDLDNGLPDMRKLFALLQDMKRKQEVTPKRFEMSRMTLLSIEKRFDLLPRTEPCSTLWGIEITFDDKLPLNEIKPIY
jgi:hypothetical protein